MPDGFLQLSGGKIHYYRFGEGEKILLGLHGFADQGKIFKSLGSKLQRPFTLYLPDLPFHGATQWPGDHYTPKDLQELVDAILSMEGKSSLQILGHSLGGRLIIAGLPDLISRLEKIYLVAPDGLGMGWMAIPEYFPIFLRRQFKKWLRDPKWLLNLVAFLKRNQLIDPFVLKYLSWHLQNEERSNRLLHTWLSTSFFRIKKSGFRKLKQQHPEILVHFIIGNKDLVVDVNQVRKLARGLPNTTITETQNGHHFSGKELADWIGSREK